MVIMGHLTEDMAMDTTELTQDGDSKVGVDMEKTTGVLITEIMAVDIKRDITVIGEITAGGIGIGATAGKESGLGIDQAVDTPVTGPMVAGRADGNMVHMAQTTAAVNMDIMDIQDTAITGRTQAMDTGITAIITVATVMAGMVDNHIKMPPINV